MLAIYQSLSFTNHNHVMFWAASTLAYFGFLCASEFTVSSLSALNPLIHLSISDIADWILTPCLPVFKLASRLPRSTLFGRAATSTLAWVIRLPVLYVLMQYLVLYEASLLTPCFPCDLATLFLVLC